MYAILYLPYAATTASQHCLLLYYTIQASWSWAGQMIESQPAGLDVWYVDFVPRSVMQSIHPDCNYSITSLDASGSGGNSVYGVHDLSGLFSGFPQYEFDDDGVTSLPMSYRRTREGVERFFITDINNPAASATAQSTLPVMWDAWGTAGASIISGSSTASVLFNHIPGGGNVLYMDGHVEFVRFRDKWPYSAPPLANGSYASLPSSHNANMQWYYTLMAEAGGFG